MVRNHSRDETNSSLNECNFFRVREEKPISGFEAATQMQWWKMKQQVSKPRD
jgi:hypothetical protein